MPQNRYPGWPKPETDCSGDKRLTVQASTDEVDINKIVKRVIKGQGVPVFNGKPFYGDVSELGGLQDSIIKVQKANDLFLAYPAHIREKFDNDPVKFVEYMSDSENMAEAIEIGLAEAPKDKKEPKPSPLPEAGK